MVNLKLGGILLMAGAAMFILSDTVFGDSDAASYSAFFGLILFPLGFVLAVVGVFQLLIGRIRESRKDG